MVDSDSNPLPYLTLEKVGRILAKTAGMSREYNHLSRNLKPYKSEGKSVYYNMDDPSGKTAPKFVANGKASLVKEVPPQKSLVGVELNPGPKNGNSKLKKLAGQVNALKTALTKPSKIKSKRKMRRNAISPYTLPAAIGSVISIPPHRVTMRRKGNSWVKVVSGLQYVTTICTSTVTGNPQFGSPGAQTDQNTWIAIDINGAGDTGGNINLVATGSPLGNEGVSYAKFLFKKLKFHFRTASSTAVSGGFTLAYAADPYSYFQMDHVKPTRATLATLQDNVTFAVWENASIDCTAINSFVEPRYDITNGTVSAATSRSEAQGCLLISSASTLAGSLAGTFGDLLMEYEVELYDSGAFNTSGISLPRLQKMACNLGYNLIPRDDSEPGSSGSSVATTSNVSMNTGLLGQYLRL